MATVFEIDPTSNPRYKPYIERYRSGEWRATIMRDLVLDQLSALGSEATVLDIGCGLGFDDSIDLQKSIAAASGKFIGIEPDPGVELGPHFSQVLRSSFEDSAIAPGSIDLAYAIMVLEHLQDPQRFWDKLHEILRPGGVFFGLTVDGRHPFSWASYWSERIGAKEAYMRLLYGRRGEGHYLNYPVHYRTNTPAQLERFVGRFGSCEAVSLSRAGQLRAAFPKVVWPLSDAFDAWIVRSGRSGTNLIVRAVKA